MSRSRYAAIGAFAVILVLGGCSQTPSAPPAATQSTPAAPTRYLADARVCDSLRAELLEPSLGAAQTVGPPVADGFSVDCDWLFANQNRLRIRMLFFDSADLAAQAYPPELVYPPAGAAAGVFELPVLKAHWKVERSNGDNSPERIRGAVLDNNLRIEITLGKPAGGHEPVIGPLTEVLDEVIAELRRLARPAG